MDKLLVQLRGSWNCPGCENAGHRRLCIGKLNERGQAVAKHVASLFSCEVLESVCSRQPTSLAVTYTLRSGNPVSHVSSALQPAAFGIPFLTNFLGLSPWRVLVISELSWEGKGGHQDAAHGARD